MNTDIFTEEQRKMLSYLLNRKDIIKFSVFFSDIIEQLMNNAEVHRGQAVENTLPGIILNDLLMKDETINKTILCNLWLQWNEDKQSPITNLKQSYENGDALIAAIENIKARVRAEEREN